MMHGQRIIKICVAKQAKQVFQYKKIKIKLYKNNAAIWYNKTCRIKHLLPNYINIKSPSLAVAQDGHLQRVTIPEATYVQFASLTS
jgi:hypothetical protein